MSEGRETSLTWENKTHTRTQNRQTKTDDPGRWGFAGQRWWPAKADAGYRGVETGSKGPEKRTAEPLYLPEGDQRPGVHSALGC